VKYFKLNLKHELKKAANGKKTKVDVSILLDSALRDYPDAQKALARALSGTEAR
jgi:hypothetical protein